MRRLFDHVVGPALVTTSLLFWSGCGGGGNSDHGPAEHENHQQGDAHHGEPGHVHKSGDQPNTGPRTSTVTPRPNEGHTEIGPNGGRLIVLGDEDYHAEVFIDHAKGEVTVCILDRTGHKPVPIDQNQITLNVLVQAQPHQILLTSAQSSAGQPELASYFAGSSDLVRSKCQLTGRLNVVIGGKPYTGRVAHHEGDHNPIRKQQSARPGQTLTRPLETLAAG